MHIPHSNVQLTPEANELIADYYTELRASSGDRALPVTVRTLETIVRLSSAHAKCRLSSKVERADVEVAREILDAVMASSNGQAVGAQGWERRPKKGAKRAQMDGDEGGESHAAADEGVAVMEDERAAVDEEMADAEQGARDGVESDVLHGFHAEVANDENADPNAESVAGLPGVTKAQLQAVGDALRACFLAPSEILGRPVSDVQARLEERGVRFSDQQLQSVLTFLDAESLEGRFGVPFTYDAEHNIVYDMS